jgi:hypothetical protein
VGFDKGARDDVPGPPKSGVEIHADALNRTLLTVMRPSPLRRSGRPTCASTALGRQRAKSVVRKVVKDFLSLRLWKKARLCVWDTEPTESHATATRVCRDGADILAIHDVTMYGETLAKNTTSERFRSSAKPPLRASSSTGLQMGRTARRVNRGARTTFSVCCRTRM